MGVNRAYREREGLSVKWWNIQHYRILQSMELYVGNVEVAIAFVRLNFRNFLTVKVSYAYFHWRHFT